MKLTKNFKVGESKLSVALGLTDERAQQMAEPFSETMAQCVLLKMQSTAYMIKLIIEAVNPQNENELAYLMFVIGATITTIKKFDPEEFQQSVGYKEPVKN